MADVAIAVAAASGLEIEVFDEDALAALGCGGLLGVNAGSDEPPRMIKLTYRPDRPTRRGGHLAMVGKGVMYDSGGISLKPSDAMHAAMKMDMSGAAAVLSSMSTLAALDCPTDGDGLPDVHRQHAVGLGDEARRRADDPRRDDRRDPQHRRRGPPAAGRRAGAGRRGAARRHRRHRHAHRCLPGRPRPGGRRRARQPPAVGRPGRRGVAAPPTSRCGSCRWRRSATASCSTPTSPTSRTSAGPTAGRSPPPCSCRSSSATCRGPTSTSPGR